MVVPAPSGGLTTLTGTGGPGDCLAFWNLAASEYGPRTRLGWLEHCTGLDGPVRSLLVFSGSYADGSRDRLFACTRTGIYDVTVQGTRTSTDRLVTFPTQNTLSGFGSCVVFATVAGHFLCFCDESNGYYIYTESTNSWAKVTDTEVTNVDPGSFVQVVNWKGMLWFIERNSGRAWYLPPGQLTGAADAFQFGNRFQLGGDLRALITWTRGGADIDDTLVALSSAGDVQAYNGSDPSQASGFYQVGKWSFPGGFPAGRRIVVEADGDLLLMTLYGLISLSRVSGDQALRSTQYDSVKIGNLYQQLAGIGRLVTGWGARLHPADNTLLLLAPQPSGRTEILALSLLNRSWSRYRDLPIGVAAEAFRGTLYFGTQDGRVCVNSGYLDAVPLSATAGNPISFSLISSFSDLGHPTLKRIHLIRPTILTQGFLPQCHAEPRYGWNLGETTAPSDLLSFAGGAVWGVSNWGQGVWATSGYDSTRRQFGGKGAGVQIAIALAGKAASRITLTGFEVVFDEGGIL